MSNTDRNVEPDPVIAADIEKRCSAICPELQQGYSIIKHSVGLRPGRKGGIRLEGEERILSNGRTMDIIHNYGHASYGFQSSFGCAFAVSDILRVVENREK